MSAAVVGLPLCCWFVIRSQTTSVRDLVAFCVVCTETSFHANTLTALPTCRPSHLSLFPIRAAAAAGEQSDPCGSLIVLLTLINQIEPGAGVRPLSGLIRLDSVAGREVVAVGSVGVYLIAERARQWRSCALATKWPLERVASIFACAVSVPLLARH